MNTEEPRVSVLMTAYNAGEYISTAIESVIAQTMPNWELVVIDDGSTDATPEIIDRFARDDSRIHPIHQPNSGVSTSRRRLLELARGEYVIFLDSDDYVDATMLAEMLQKADESGADIVVADHMVEFQNGKTEMHSQNLGIHDSRELQAALLDGRLFGGLCNKLIRREVYQRHGCDFSENLWMGEDMVQVLKMLRGGASVAYMGKGFYHYRYFNTSSLSNRGGRLGLERRMAWIDTCERITRGDFPREIGFRKFMVRYFGLMHGVISRGEFHTYGTLHWGDFRKVSGNRRFLPGMLLASIGLFHLGALWCKLMQRK